MSQSGFDKQNGFYVSALEHWLKAYAEQGEEGLALHRNCYVALHSSKMLNEMEQLQLRMARLEANEAQLKRMLGERMWFPEGIRCWQRQESVLGKSITITRSPEKK